jgi:hypothetical protein
MEQETRAKNIYEKLSNISSELSAVAKNLEVGYGQSKYKAVGEADVLKAIKPLEAKHKIYSYPYSRQIIESGTIESVNAKGEIKKNLFERIEVVYRFVNIENPEEFIDITSYGDGIDSQDKSVGKAMTYADKYALLKAYKIVTGDDPDQEASEPLRTAETQKKTYTRPAARVEAVPTQAVKMQGETTPKAQNSQNEALQRLTDYWVKASKFKCDVKGIINTLRNGKKLTELSEEELKAIIQKIDKEEENENGKQ